MSAPGEGEVHATSASHTSELDIRQQSQSDAPKAPSTIPIPSIPILQAEASDSSSDSDSDSDSSDSDSDNEDVQPTSQSAGAAKVKRGIDGRQTQEAAGLPHEGEENWDTGFSFEKDDLGYDFNPEDGTSIPGAKRKRAGSEQVGLDDLRETIERAEQGPSGRRRGEDGESSDSDSDESHDDDDMWDKLPEVDGKDWAKVVMEQAKGEARKMRTQNEQDPNTIVFPTIGAVPLDVEIKELGTIRHFMEPERLIVIDGVALNRYEDRVPDQGTWVVLQDRTPVGAIWDVFGQVAQPKYTIGFNNWNKLLHLGIPDPNPYLHIPPQTKKPDVADDSSSDGSSDSSSDDDNDSNIDDDGDIKQALVVNGADDKPSTDLTGAKPNSDQITKASEVGNESVNAKDVQVERHRADNPEEKEANNDVHVKNTEEVEEGNVDDNGTISARQAPRPKTTMLYYVIPNTKYAFISHMRKNKGIDNSGAYDEEPDPDKPPEWFSDDETEQYWKRKMKENARVKRMRKMGHDVEERDIQPPNRDMLPPSMGMGRGSRGKRGQRGRRGGFNADQDRNTRFSSLPAQSTNGFKRRRSSSPDMPLRKGFRGSGARGRDRRPYDYDRPPSQNGGEDYSAFADHSRQRLSRPPTNGFQSTQMNEYSQSGVQFGQMAAWNQSSPYGVPNSSINVHQQFSPNARDYMQQSAYQQMPPHGFFQNQPNPYTYNQQTAYAQPQQVPNQAASYSQSQPNPYAVATQPAAAPNTQNLFALLMQSGLTQPSNNAAQAPAPMAPSTSGGPTAEQVAAFLANYRQPGGGPGGSGQQSSRGQGGFGGR